MNRKWLLPYLCVLALGLLWGCQLPEEERLVPLETGIGNLGYTNVEADFCLGAGSVVHQKIKYIFAIDRSSSNWETDADGSRREVPLMNFIDGQLPDPGYIYYALVNFSTNADYVRFTGNAAFTDNKEEFKAKIATSTINGNTNYSAAFTVIRDIIQQDANATAVKAFRDDMQPAGSIYMIIFVSDGYPTKLAFDGISLIPVPYNPEIKNTIDSTIAMKYGSAKINYFDGTNSIPTPYSNKNVIDNIVINTGYYFTGGPDADAEDTLRKMAMEGGGQYLPFSGGEVVDYSKFAVPVRKVKHVLSDIFVDNISTTWWDDGRFLSDFDSDGLPDEVEAQFGADPARVDSDGNGVSDHVEYRIKGRPCKDAGCNRHVSLRDNYAVCSGLRPALNPDGTPNPSPDGVNVAPFGTNYFEDMDHDGLNDCEEMLLKSIRDYFDSNADGIPDLYSMKNRIPFIQGVNFLFADADSDNVDNYLELKLGTSPVVSNQRFPSFIKRTHDIIQIDKGVSEPCYHATVYNVATLGNENIIDFYVIENTSVILNKKVMQKARGKLSVSGENLVFQRTDFVR